MAGGISPAPRGSAQPVRLLGIPPRVRGRGAGIPHLLVREALGRGLKLSALPASPRQATPAILVLPCCGGLWPGLGRPRTPPQPSGLCSRHPASQRELALGAGAVSQPGQCGSRAAGGCWELAQSTSRAVTLTIHPGSMVQPAWQAGIAFQGSGAGSLSSPHFPSPGWLGFVGAASLVHPPCAKPAEQVGSGTVCHSPSHDIQTCKSPPSWGSGPHCPQRVPVCSPGQPQSPEQAGDRARLLGACCPRRNPGWEQKASLGVNWGRIWLVTQILL